MNQRQSSPLRIHALRLNPGEDLRGTLERDARERSIVAGFIVTAVGSLRRAVLRFADAGDASIFEEKFEIVSLAGTLSTNGVHLHIALANAKGATKAGHLLPGCEIYTTAEIIIGEATDLLFAREPDAQTGFRELVIRARPKPLE